MRRLQQAIFLLLIATIFGVFLILPIIQVINVAFFGMGDQKEGFTFGYIAAIFQDEALREGLFNSAKIAVGTTLLCMLIAVPLAMLSVRYNFWGKGLMSGLLLVPLILPPFVGAIGMRQILGHYGSLTAVVHEAANWLGQYELFAGVVKSSGLGDKNMPIDWVGNARIWGVILVEALSLYPILFLNVSAALANLDPAMEQAAANLGAKRWTIFRKITLPLMRPGLFAGGTIVLIWSFTELGTPLMFEYYRCTPVQIFQRLTQVSSNPTPYALVVVTLVMSVGLYVVGKLVLGRNLGSAVTKASVQATPKQLGFFKGFLALVPFAIVTFLALLPHVGVVLMSVSEVRPESWYQSVIPTSFTADHYRTALAGDNAIPSVRNSVIFALCSTSVDIVLGLMIAWLIVRSPLPSWLRTTVDSLAMLPLAVPGLVMAFGYLAMSLSAKAWLSDITPSFHNWFGQGNGDWLKIKLDTILNVQENPTFFLIIAYAMRRLPYVVRSAVAGLQQTPADLELAARNLGAGSWLTMRRITVPLIAANLVAGGLLAFAFAMLEVSDSLILAQKADYWPITKAIYELFFRIGDGRYIASALGVWAMVLLMLTILSANTLLGKKMGAIFRV